MKKVFYLIVVVTVLLNSCNDKTKNEGQAKNVILLIYCTLQSHIISILPTSFVVRCKVTELVVKSVLMPCFLST